MSNPVRNPHWQDEIPKRDQRQSGWGDGRSGRDVKVQYVSVRGKPCWYFAEPLPSEANKSWPAKQPQERIRKRLIIKDDDFEFLRLCSIRLLAQEPKTKTSDYQLFKIRPSAAVCRNGEKIRTGNRGMWYASGWWLAGVVRYLVRCLAGIVRRLAGRSVHGYAVSWIERPRLSSQSPISGRTIHEMNERWTERPTCVFALAG